jgi:hypothetical protein
MKNEARDWRDLCAAASKEQDSQELMALISALVKALDEDGRYGRLGSSSHFSVARSA